MEKREQEMDGRERELERREQEMDRRERELEREKEMDRSERERRAMELDKREEEMGAAAETSSGLADRSHRSTGVMTLNKSVLIYMFTSSTSVPRESLRSNIICSHGFNIYSIE